MTDLKKICDDVAEVAKENGYRVASWNVGTPEFRSGGIARIHLMSDSGAVTDLQIVSMVGLGTVHMSVAREGQKAQSVSVGKKGEDRHTDLRPDEITRSLIKKILSRARDNGHAAAVKESPAGTRPGR